MKEVDKQEEIYGIRTCQRDLKNVILKKCMTKFYKPDSEKDVRVPPEISVAKMAKMLF